METMESLEEGYRKEKASLLEWLGARVGWADAEDALHDVVARSLANLDTMEPIRDMAGWLWRAARNAVTDAWRKRARRAAAGEAEADDFDAFMDDRLRDASDEAEHGELLEALYAAIDALPGPQRDVIVDQAIRGETFASISARTGVAPETLAARKRYALARLRASLEDFL